MPNKLNVFLLSLSLSLSLNAGAQTSEPEPNSSSDNLYKNIYENLLPEDVVPLMTAHCILREAYPNRDFCRKLTDNDEEYCEGRAANDYKFCRIKSKTEGEEDQCEEKYEKAEEICTEQEWRQDDICTENFTKDIAACLERHTDQDTTQPDLSKAEIINQCLASEANVNFRYCKWKAADTTKYCSNKVDIIKGFCLTKAKSEETEDQCGIEVHQQAQRSCDVQNHEAIVLCLENRLNDAMACVGKAITESE